MSTISHIYSLVYNINVRFWFFINYFSEHQLPHAVDASHTTPTIRVNQGPKLLKLIGWRYCLCFRWVPYILGTTASDAWRWTRPVLLVLSNSNSSNIRWMPVILRNLAVEPSFRLHNLYLRSTQNTDIISSINFPDPSVSCLFIILFNSVKWVNIHVT